MTGTESCDDFNLSGICILCSEIILPGKCSGGSSTTPSFCWKCGDSNLNSDEQCDDGNLNDNDGCDKNCLLEGPIAFIDKVTLWNDVHVGFNQEMNF